MALNHRLSIFCFYVENELDLTTLYNEIEINREIVAVRLGNENKGVDKKHWRRPWKALFVSAKCNNHKINFRIYNNGTIQWSSGLTEHAVTALYHTRLILPILVSNRFKVCNHIYSIMLPKRNCDSVVERLPEKGFVKRYQVCLYRKNPCETYQSSTATINHYVRACIFTVSAKSRELAQQALL